MLRASYGRFSQGVLTGEFAPFHPGVDRRPRPRISIRRPAATPRSRPVRGSKTNLRLDPDIRAPHTDEYSIGVDREVGRRLAVAIAYVHKDGANFIGWTDVGGQYRRGDATVARRPSVPVFELAQLLPPIGAFC